jgi:uncharacterized protein (TIGR02147 family)
MLNSSTSLPSSGEFNSRGSVDIPSDKFKSQSRPSIFSYLDFRHFLKDMLIYKKTINPSFSENAFVYAAGFGKNSRGYLGLILKNKRNLTSKSVIGFSTAMNLKAHEAIYFENMVHFNQAKTEKEKLIFFERMKVSAQGKKAKLVKVLEHQYRYLNEWHLVVLREIVLLKDFREDPGWVVEKLGGKISKEKVVEGFNDLLELGLLGRTQEGKLVQAESVIHFEDDSSNFKSSTNLHRDFALRASKSIAELPYEKRAAQLITLSIPTSRFEDLRDELKRFTKKILEEYTQGNHEVDEIVVQIGSQLLNLTD